MDFRERFFGSAVWYRELVAPHGGEPSAWYLAKSDEHRSLVDIMNAGLSFAVKHGLENQYRQRFCGISPQALSVARAEAESRSVTFPIAAIANELIVGFLLESGLGWAYVSHEPAGHRSRRGEWEFCLSSGKAVFVEVKSLGEPDFGSGSFTKPRAVPRLTGVLKHAYQQLPEDERATVVVMVAEGGILLDTPYGIVNGDLFQAFFGETVLKFDFDGAQLSNPQPTSTFRSMFVQRRKNRRLGAVFGLEYRGLEVPAPNFYAVHNPFAHASSSLPMGVSRVQLKFG